MIKSIDFLVETVNKCGGVLGKPITYLKEDDRTDPPAGAEAMTKLVKVDNVGAVVGGGGNGATGAPQPSPGGTNTGGGGGGTDDGSYYGGAGGSGIVLVRYLTASGIEATGGTTSTSGSYTIHTFTSNGTFSITKIPTDSSKMFQLF
jgi:hypothetical protein